MATRKREKRHRAMTYELLIGRFQNKCIHDLDTHSLSLSFLFLFMYTYRRTQTLSLSLFLSLTQTYVQEHTHGFKACDIWF